MTDTATSTLGQNILTYLKTTASAHLVIIGLAVVGFVFFRSFMAEHDARLQADTTVKSAQTQIQSLQAQQATVTKDAAVTVTVLQKEAAAVKTPVQAVQALQTPAPDMAETVAPLEVAALPDAPGRVSVNALPLNQDLNTCRQDAVNLGACTSTLGLEKQIEAQKDIEIVALKKKPGFWHRVKTTLITLGIGTAAGYAIAHR